MFAILLLVCWAGFQEPRVLALKNGKTIACDSFEVVDGRVNLRVNGKSLSLPEKLVDWARTEALQAEATVVETEPADQAQRGWRPHEKPDEPVALTEDTLVRTDGAGSGPTTVNYEKWGNSIIVRARLNGRGPFRFILDTGAEMTLISPRVARQIGAPPLERRIDVLGVNGKPVAASLVRLDEVSLGASKVRRLRAAAHAIPAINSQNVAGLLGQDFLNHFVFQLNPSARTLTLTSNATGRTAAALERQFEDVLRDAPAIWQEIETIGASLAPFYNAFMGQSEPIDRSRELVSIKAYAGRLPSLQSRMNTFNNAIRNIEPASLPEEARNDVAWFTRCYPALSRHLRTLQQFLQGLRKAYSRSDSDDFARQKTPLQNDWLALIDTGREVLSCR